MMFIETVQTQRRMQEVLHEMYCTPDCSGEWAQWTPCKRGSVRMLGMVMLDISTEMFPVVRADEREKVAYRIEAELVCCDLYEQLNNSDFSPHVLPRDAAGILGLDYHSICHWGGFAADVARSGDGPGHWAPSEPARWKESGRDDRG